jgi:two-component system, NtrC family, response regulator HydG
LANENRFRKDLIYRINTVEILVPPLRNRDKDIDLLAEFFLDKYASKYNKGTMGFSEKALKKLRDYSFPGNVRELQYTIERAVIMADDVLLNEHDLVFSALENPLPVGTSQDETQLSTLEKNAILRVIDKHQGNITRAAKELGITRTALYRRLEKYDI